MWPFKKVDADQNLFRDDVSYVAAWERRPLPNENGTAKRMAWVSYALPVTVPVGRAVAALREIRTVAPQTFSPQTLIPAGMPTVAGQMAFQPLLDPNAPYGASLSQGYYRGGGITPSLNLQPAAPQPVM